MKTKLLLLGLLLASSAAAQIPPHHAVVGTITVGGPPVTQRGTTGVFVVPLPTTANPGPFVPTRITGLPPGLEASVAVPGASAGAFSVAYRPEDNTLFVGNISHSRNGRTGTLSIHVMNLNGTAAQNVVSLQVGQIRSGFGLGVSSLTPLPDGRVLAVVGRTSAFVSQSGPAAVSPLLVVDTSGGTPTLTPIPVSPAIPGFAESGTVSRDGSTAYVMSQPGNGTVRWTLYAVSLVEGTPDYGRPVFLRSWSERTRNPEMRADGKLQVAGYNSTTSVATKYVIDVSTSPVGVTASPITPQNLSLVGPRMEPATGAAVYTSTAWSGTAAGLRSALLIDAANDGNISLVASEPAAGWCIAAGLSIHSAFDRYGEGTPAGASYEIVSEANPGGLPELGNAGFGVTIRASGGVPTVSSLVVGAARGSFDLAGLRALILPVLGLPMTTQGQDSTVSLPIANNVSLLGAQLFVQGVHLDAGGAAASDAARIQVIR